MAELDPFQAEIARLALMAAEGHGFALAGSNALAVHGIIARPTEDVDLVELAYQADPDLREVEFTDAMRRLDRLDDAVFLEQYRLPPEQVQRIRAAFTDWPR